MKLTKVKKIFVTSLLLLGTISMLGGCGSKGNSDFTKEEMDEIDAVFSADERKELEAELGGGSSSRKTTQYDETITIDPFEDVNVVIRGTEPDETYIHIECPETEYSEYIYVHVSDDIDEESISAGDTVPVVVEYLLDNETKLERKLQKNVEFSRETVELEVIANPTDYKRMFVSWDELTEEQKNEIMTYAIENIEAKTDDQYWYLFNTDDHEVEGLLAHSESYTISDPVGIYWCCIPDVVPCVNYAAIGFDVTDATDYTMTVYFPIKNMIIDENTGEFSWAYHDEIFSTIPGITDLAEIDNNRGFSDYPKTTENSISEYISLR